MDRRENTSSGFDERQPLSVWSVNPEGAFLEEWRSRRIDMGIFRKIAEERTSADYTQSSLARDEEKLIEVRKHQGDGSQMGPLAEAVSAIIADRFGWLGNHPSSVEVMTEFDDRVGRVDAVKEVVIPGPDGRDLIIRWAEDVTSIYPDDFISRSTSDEDKAKAEVEAKVKGMHDEVEECGFAATVRYYKSEVGSCAEPPQELIAPVRMPKVVISLPWKDNRSLVALYARLKGGDRKAADELRVHPARLEYLAQVRAALTAQLKFLDEQISLRDLGDEHRRVGTHLKTREDGGVAKYKKAREEVSRTLDYIKTLIDSIDPEYRMKNEWLQEFYRRYFGYYEPRT